MERKRSGPCICKRSESGCLPSIVLMSASPGQDLLHGRAPRSLSPPVVAGIALTLLYVSREHCFPLSTFFISFHSHNSLEEKQGTSSFIVEMWSSCPVLCYCLTVIMHTRLPAKLSSPHLSSLCFISSPSSPTALYSTPSHSIPSLSAPKLLTEVTVVHQKNHEL